MDFKCSFIVSIEDKYGFAISYEKYSLQRYLNGTCKLLMYCGDGCSLIVCGFKGWSKGPRIQRV